jgi:ATP-dependent exoDNAse (exonuclease V) alpha subunit
VSKTSLIFDLVPGIGKTFQMIKLMEMYNNDIIICTPTAISAQLYNSRNVRTVHSTFKLDPFTNIFDLKIENIDKFKKYKAIVFDEFSMISHWIFVKIFMELPKDIVVILVGDSSQLAPPMGKEPDFDKLSKYRNFKTFSTDYSCKIFRFYESTGDNNNNFVQNISRAQKTNQDGQ